MKRLLLDKEFVFVNDDGTIDKYNVHLSLEEKKYREFIRETILSGKVRKREGKGSFVIELESVE
jgi:hypothetical protein